MSLIGRAVLPSLEKNQMKRNRTEFAPNPSCLGAMTRRGFDCQTLQQEPWPIIPHFSFTFTAHLFPMSMRPVSVSEAEEVLDLRPAPRPSPSARAIPLLAVWVSTMMSESTSLLKSPVGREPSSRERHRHRGITLPERRRARAGGEHA